MQNIPIRYINYGIGYHCTDNGKSWIELNKDLKRYPELHQAVLQHELGHNTGNRMDFLHDLRDYFNPSLQFKLFKFSLKHPRALLSVSPILFDKKGIGTNWFMFAFWGFLLGLLILGGMLL